MTSLPRFRLTLCLATALAFAGVTTAAPAGAGPPAPAVLVGPIAPIQPTAASPTTASAYHPVTPFAVRSAKARIAAGHPVTVPLAGRKVLPGAGQFDAVTVAVTVSDASRATSASLVETGTSTAIRVVSAAAHRRATGVAVMPVGPAGKIRARVSAGRARLRIVVTGYQSTGLPGETFHALAPATVLAAHRFGVGASRRLTIVGAPRTGLPSNGQVAAVALAVSVARPSATTAVTAYPHGTPAAAVTAVSAHRGVTTSGAAILAVGSHGQVVLRNSRGHATIGAKVEGYWTTDPTGSSFHPVRPAPLLKASLAPKESHRVRVAGRHGLPSAGQITSVALSITTGAPSQSGTLAVEPTAHGSTRTTILNTAAHTHVTATVLARLTGSTLFFTASHRTPVSVSVVGWYAANATGTDLDASAGSCAGPIAATNGFAVVRATDGQPYGSADASCFATETLDAKQLPAAPEFYLNLADPGKESSHWDQGGPRACHVTTNFDPGCGYDYGYLAAKQAVAFARANGAPAAGRWWVDVEPDNTWGNPRSGPPSHVAANVADIQGALGYLDSHGYPAGVYTETLWWEQITGVPPALSHVPVWGGGAGSAALARANCKQVSITGGPALLVQWFTSAAVDHDIAC
ncbi:MAG TPA: hypothetical protein VHV79_02735 [Mycobacteriales bacterium]|nr:hypothetical protein [Mycobacteriales bacterium]